MANWQSQSSQYLSLDPVSSVPDERRLRQMHTLARENKGKIVQQPFRAHEHGASFHLTATVQEGTGEESWILYKGEGAQGGVEWTLNYTDIDYIFDFLCMSASQAAHQVKPAAETDKARQAEAQSASFSSAGKESRLADLKPGENQPNVLLGQILVDSGMLTPSDLDRALEVQELVRAGKLDSWEATGHLKRALANMEKIQASEAKSKGASRERVEKGVELLKRAGLITEEDIQNAVISELGGHVGKILVASGRIDQNTFDAAVECQSMLEGGMIRTEQAIIALHYSSRMRVGFKEALEETATQT